MTAAFLAAPVCYNSRLHLPEGSAMNAFGVDWHTVFAVMAGVSKA